MKQTKLLLLALILAVATGCVETAKTVERRSSALDYLYPEGAEAQPGAEITLQLPLRVAVVFAPGSQNVPEELKMQLLERVASSFRARAFLANVEVLPSHYLNVRGGFSELGALARMLGFTEVVLVSYDQHQFSAPGTSSWTYWTIVGAAVVQGEKNETKTVLDALVYDVPSRSLLLRAAGQSSIKGKSLVLAVDKKLQEASADGFQIAANDLVGQLNVALDEFERQAVHGTVRGPGTPAVSVFDSASGRPVEVRADGGGFDWGGALDVVQVMAILVFLSLGAIGARYARRGER